MGSLFVYFSDGRKWRCDLYAPIKEETSAVKYEGMKLEFSLVKFDPIVQWPQLQVNAA